MFDAPSSIDPRTMRRRDDPGGSYGTSRAKAAVGHDRPDTSPNLLIISVERAGYAEEEPTEAQQYGPLFLVYVWPSSCCRSAASPCWQNVRRPMDQAVAPIAVFAVTAATTAAIGWCVYGSVSAEGAPDGMLLRGPLGRSAGT